MDRAGIHGFRKILRRFERVLTRQVEECYCCSGVTLAQCHLLLELEELGPTHVQALADSLNLDKSTVSRTVDGLVGLGLVDRQPSREDRRFNIVRLTGHGSSTCAAIHRVNDDYFGRVFDQIPEEKRAGIIRSLGILTTTMQEVAPPNE